MRMTVGQLPPSVYWRRRAVVLAAVLVVVLIIAFSCTGGDEPKKNSTANPTTTGEPTTPSSTPSVATTITPNASDPSSGQPINQGGGVTGAGATGETCADSELLVTASAQNTTVRQGVPVTFFIRIKNTSTRQCSRDLSAQAQELYLEQNQVKQWSSDACTNSTSSGDVRTMQPNIEHEFNVPWNGQGNTQNCTNRQFLKAGSYQLRARLGNIVSEPVTVTVNQ
jgi:hypothetical protein